MADWIGPILLFAQRDGAKEPPGSQMLQFLPLVAVAVLFYLILLRPQRREQRRQEDMLKALKKNDRVVTIGGMIGAVANVSTDGKEVTLKVDDNTRIKFLKSSIQRVLTEDTKDEAPKAS